MRAVFDASWQQLSVEERQVFRHLSVFRGGFPQAAALGVSDTQKSLPNFLHMLTGLVCKSLLRFNPEHDRYEIHELLRQYGADKLAGDPVEESMVRDRHSAYYCATLQHRQTDIQFTPKQEVMVELEDDSENIRAAWSWAVTQMQITRLAHSMDNICHFYSLRGHYKDGEKSARLIVDTLTQDELAEWHPFDAQCLLVKALAWQSHFYRLMGRTEMAEHCLQKGLVILDSPGFADQETRSEKAFLLKQRGWLAELFGHYEESKEWFEKSLALYRTLGDDWGVAGTIGALGWQAFALGNLHEAKQYFEEGLTLYQAQGNSWGVTDALRGLGWVARGFSDYEKARRLFNESLVLSKAESNQRGISTSLDQLGYLALFQGRFEEGVDFLWQSVDISREIGDRVELGLGLLHLGAALWLSGKQVQGYSYMEESLRISNDLEDDGLIINATHILARTNVYLGRYKQARAQAQMVMTPRASLPDRQGVAQRTLGWVALVEEKYTEAQQSMQESVATLRGIKEHENVAWSLAGLGRTSYALGNRSEAKQHIYEALEIAVEIGAFIPLLYIMPIVSLFLADQGEVERAFELYSMASQHPFVSQGQLFEDIAGRDIAALAATLSSDVFEAAKERGKACDMWDTASELLEELPKLGWSKPVD
jgi:tetratricopeptide (TPR) repeat protein